ncbi:hypothetical protein NE237_024475 [Protea cynaroides]|uniref:Uncharacterized protein n=1 Tax=Protea cynaroides TaxID=273540 RepID=A0A9Q0JT30_9MAGN|nr:hypothetical protein NE237_024475 [Protea cynaroides]
MIKPLHPSPSTLYPSSVLAYSSAPVPNNHLPLNLVRSLPEIHIDSSFWSHLRCSPHCNFSLSHRKFLTQKNYNHSVWEDLIGSDLWFCVCYNSQKEFVILISVGLEWKSASARPRIVALEYSESFFRDNESEALRKLSLMRQLVVATGGGVVIRPINWKYMKRGITVPVGRAFGSFGKAYSSVGTDSRPLLHEESGDAYSKRHWYKSSIL